MSRTTVLLIEDEDAHAELVCRRLPEEEFDCRRAESITEAVELFRESPADVVLTDQSLPDSTPDETLTKVRCALPGVPVVVLTSLDDAEFARRRVAEGAQDYLVKDGINSQTLQQSIRYAIERARFVEEIARSNAELKAFAHTLAHEVRTPAATALMALSAADLPQDGQSSQFIKVAKTSLESLNDLVADLLSFAEVESSGSETEDVDLTPIAEAAVDLSRPQLTRVGGRVHIDDLPTVRGHANQLKLLFRNLVENAIKYRSPSRPLSLTIGAGETAGEVTVADNGRGIAGEHLDRVFDVFYRAHRSVETITGTGVGLALCKRIVSRYEGDIRVESDGSSGTTVRLTFPGGAKDGAC